MVSLGVMMVAWAITLGLAVLAVAALWRPLRVLLLELCGTEERSRFWTVWSAVIMILVPMLAVSGVEPGEDFGLFLKRVVFYALGGILVALLGMGKAVWSRTPRAVPPDAAIQPEVR